MLDINADLPVVGSDGATWGIKLNDTLLKIAAYVNSIHSGGSGGVVDNNDGTLSSTPGSSITDNGDGTLSA